MKRIVLFTAVAALLTACGGKESTPVLDVTPSMELMEFSADGVEEFVFTVTTNQPAYSVTLSESFITVTNTANGFKVTVSENTAEDTRTGTVTVTASECEPVVINLSQAGAPVPTNYITYNGNVRAINYAGVYEATSQANIVVFSSKPLGANMGSNCDYLLLYVPMDLNGRTLNLATDNTSGTDYMVEILHADGLFSNVDILPFYDPATGTYYVNKAGGVWSVDLVDVSAGVGSITAHFEGEINTSLAQEFSYYNMPDFTSAVTLGSGGSYALPNGPGWVVNFDNNHNTATGMFLRCENDTDFFEIDLNFYHPKGTVLTSGTYTYSVSQDDGTFGETYLEGDYSALLAHGKITGGSITIDVEAGTLTFNGCTTSKAALGTINGTLTFDAASPPFSAPSHRIPKMARQSR